MKDKDIALRQIASDTLKAMCLVTNTSMTDLANRIRLHRTNIATFINQDRLYVLGWSTIRRLLRVYGFDIRDDGLSIRESEACPAIAYPHTDAVAQGLTRLIEILKSSGMQCQFRAFEVGSNDSGLHAFPSGGLLFAQFDGKIWAAIGLDRMSSELGDFFANADEVSRPDPILVHEEQFLSWEDSAPHRSEVVGFFKTEDAKK
jgi:hypothetical protein